MNSDARVGIGIFIIQWMCMAAAPASPPEIVFMETGAEILQQTYRTIESYSEDKNAVFKAPDIGIALSYLNELLGEWAYYEIIDGKFIAAGDSDVEVSLHTKNAIIYNLAWIMAVHCGHAVSPCLKRQADWSLNGIRAGGTAPVIVDRREAMRWRA